jgi:hypothetical protein
MYPDDCHTILLSIKRNHKTLRVLNLSLNQSSTECVDAFINKLADILSECANLQEIRVRFMLFFKTLKV